MRGLKLKDEYDFEIKRLSHLLQMRGLKPVRTDGENFFIVASFTDAWIETEEIAPGLVDTTLVASFTDAWIETP